MLTQEASQHGLRWRVRDAAHGESKAKHNERGGCLEGGVGVQDSTSSVDMQRTLLLCCTRGMSECE